MIFSIVVSLAGAGVQGEVDVLAQSKSGKVLCSNPEASSRRCSSIASYTTSPDGAIIETTEVLLAPDRAITLTMSIGTQVAGGSICGLMTSEDLRRGQVRVDGEALPPDRNALALERLEASMGSLVGKRLCDAIRIENSGLVKYGQVEGVDIKLPGKPVAWVSLNDGYKVAPR